MTRGICVLSADTVLALNMQFIMYTMYVHVSQLTVIISITIVQSDTGKYQELVAPYYYECATRVILL